VKLKWFYPGCDYQRLKRWDSDQWIDTGYEVKRGGRKAWLAAPGGDFTEKFDSLREAKAEAERRYKENAR
jgi:hypothetical protein